MIEGRYRLKSARRPNPARGHGEQSVGGRAGKTSPDSARQSLAPQPGTAPEGDWKSIIAHSACPPDLKRLLTQQTALLEVTDSSSLRSYLETPRPDPLVIQAQLRLLEQRLQHGR